jgi:hypothetical protein
LSRLKLFMSGITREHGILQNLKNNLDQRQYRGLNDKEHDNKQTIYEDWRWFAGESTG